MYSKNTFKKHNFLYIYFQLLKSFVASFNGIEEISNFYRQIYMETGKVTDFQNIKKCIPVHSSINTNLIIRII